MSHQLARMASRDNYFRRQNTYVYFGSDIYAESYNDPTQPLLPVVIGGPPPLPPSAEPLYQPPSSETSTEEMEHVWDEWSRGIEGTQGHKPRLTRVYKKTSTPKDGYQGEREEWNPYQATPYSFDYREKQTVPRMEATNPFHPDYQVAKQERDSVEQDSWQEVREALAVTTTAPVSDLDYRNQGVRVKTKRAPANPGPCKQLRTPPESDEKYRYYREAAKGECSS